MTRETYTVGQLAAELGVSTRTLRFYEEAGIVTPARTGSGAARSYTGRDRARLVLALRGKRFGMSLAEIRDIVDMYDAEPGEAGQIRRLLTSLETVRADLESRQRELTSTLTEVEDVTRRCQRRLDELAQPAPGAGPGQARRPATISTPLAAATEEPSVGQSSSPRTSPPTRAKGSGSGKVARGPTARGGPAGNASAHTSPESGAKSR